MTNISFTEAETGLQGPNQTAAASGSVSSINGMLHYRFKTEGRKAYFGQFTFPLTAGTTGSYMGAGGGMEYYWGLAPAKVVLLDSTTSFMLTPVTRYFAYGSINFGYLAYLTPTAKKNDTLLELEGGGGISRRMGKWTLRAQAGLARGVGIVTSTMGMKAMFGGTFFLE